MNLNLTAEGIFDVIGLQTAKTPASSYKKDNQDLRPDDRPWFTVATKQGLFYNYMHQVIDKSSGLGHWRRNHPNDTRYITANQSDNYPKPAQKSSYVKPEIRVDKVFETDFVETIKNNRSTKIEDPDSLNFVYSDHITSKGKKFVMLLDQHGYMNYFFTRNFK